MNAKIIRVERSIEGIFGVLKLEYRCFCVTIENEELSIPDGEYVCYRYQSPKNGEVWELQDVPGRTHIQIHPANEAYQLLGCIAVGQYFDKLRGNRAILNSGNTFEQFMKVTKQANRLDLTIDSYRDLSRFKGNAL
jgi:hypothetical protein